MALSEKELAKEIERRRNCARAWVEEAYKMARDAQPYATVTVKTDQYGRTSDLTDTDPLVEAFLKEMILRIFPNDAIIGEEGADAPVTEGCFCWILDPIDGTDNFSIRSQPWAVSIGIVYNGMPVVAAVAVDLACLPENRRVFSTAVGAGEVLLGDKPWVLRPARPVGRWILGMEGLKRIAGAGQLVEQLWAACYQPRTLSSYIGQSCAVAVGILTAHIEGFAGLWDVVAVDLIARNLGLICTRWNGSPLFPHVWEVAMADLPAYRCNYGQFDVLVAHPSAHPTLLEILKPHAGQVERDAAKKLAEQKAKK